MCTSDEKRPLLQMSYLQNFINAIGPLYVEICLLFFFRIFHDILEIFCLNYGILTLLPKSENADKIQQYMSICLLNVTVQNLH